MRNTNPLPLLSLALLCPALDAQLRVKPVLRTPARATTARMTAFDPARHGFQFVNTFNNDVVSALDIRTGGLCGGMSYAAADYFCTRTPTPNQAYRPANRTTLQSYLYQRQVDSLASVGALGKWAEAGFNPGGARNGEFFRWGLKDRLPELRRALDAGRPVPLGVYGVTNATHQILAIGYDMGRYRGDLGRHIEDFRIFVYDPNHPRQRLTMVPDVRNQWFHYKELPQTRWRTWFADSRYAPKKPPVVTSPRYPRDGMIHELVVSFRTGRDDLRGGNDNVHVTLDVAGGGQQVFRDVNLRARWLSNYIEYARIVLKQPVKPTDLLSMEIATTFRGGVGGDNWDVEAASVRVVDGGQLGETLQPRNRAFPFRFTGHRKSLKLVFRDAPAAAPGQFVKVLLEVTTGRDDLRGGNDNLDVTVTYADGRRQVFRNVNGARRWADRSHQIVHLDLDRAVRPADLRCITLSTTSRGGVGGDNWNLAALVVKTGEARSRTLYSRTGGPLFRFTARQRSFSIDL